MEYVSIGRFIWSFVFVLGLIGLLALLAKRYGVGAIRVKNPAEARLEIVEVLPIDARHRLVIIRRDEVEHLLVKGPERIQVIETGFPAKHKSRADEPNGDEHHDA